MSEKVTVKVERSVLHLPAIALRGLVVFPNNLLHFEVGREKSIAAVEWAVSNNSDVFLVAQKEMKVEDPKAADLYTYGVVAEVKQVMRVSDDLVRILVEGKYRARLSEMEDDGSFLLATVRPAPVKMAKPEELPEADVLVRNVKKSFDDLLALNPHIGKDVVFAITTSTDAAFLSEYIPANLLFRFEDKQAILDEGTLMGRLHLLIEKMHRERRMLEIDKEIAQKVDEAMDKNQRDYYLHEQLHMISEELGEDDDTTAEAEEYRRKITALHLDEDREKKLLKEVDRLSKMQSSNQEGTVIRTYLDTCLDLPWNLHRGRSGHRQGPAGAGPGPLRPEEGQGPHPRGAGRPQAGPRCEGPDHLPRRPSGCRQDQHRPLHRREPEPQVCPHQPRRRAG